MAARKAAAGEVKRTRKKTPKASPKDAPWVNPEIDQGPRNVKTTTAASNPKTQGKTKDPLKEDFRKFLFFVWKHLQLPDPTPVQYNIAWYMQHGPRRKMIMAFRGVGKSWIYAAFVCWRLYCDPDWKVMVVSASKPLADALSIFVKRLIAEMPILQHLRPRDGQRDSNIMFDVGPARASKDPSVKSVGITGQITGSRADEILADDIESLNNSATQVQREKLAELIKEFDAVVKPGGIISYLGTPQSENTIYELLAERGYEIRVWPGRVPADPDKYKGRLAPYVIDKIAKGAKVGDPLDPKRFDDLDLREREASYGRSGFALQFMLDTSLSDAERYPLKLADLMVMDLDLSMAHVKYAWAAGEEQVLDHLPNVGLTGDRFHKPMWKSEEVSEYASGVMFVDPSGRGKDETAYAIVKWLHGYLFLVATGGYRDGYSEDTLSALVKEAQTHGVKKCLVESNFGDGMFVQLMKPFAANKAWPMDFEEVRATTQKEARIIDTLEPVMNQHRLIVARKAVERDHETSAQRGMDVNDPKYGLFYQMTRLTRDRGALIQDDRLDALSGAVQWYQQHMAVNTDKSVKKMRDKALDEELRRFKRTVKGRAINAAHVNGRPKARNRRLAA